MLSMRVILTAVVAAALYISGTNATRQSTRNIRNFRTRQAEAVKQWNLLPLVRDTTINAVKNITFSNPKASGSFLPRLNTSLRIR